MTIDAHPVRPTRTGLTVAEAIERLRRPPQVTDVETVPLDAAVGRVLAEDVLAVRAVPQHASSAMDGYAFRHADLPVERVLRVRGRVAAGHVAEESLVPGSAVRIFTGAAMPTGADTVAMQEVCEVVGDAVDGHAVVGDAVVGDAVRIPADLAPGTHVRPAGNDMAANTRALTAGDRMGPRQIGLAAAVGRSALRVRRRLRVAVIATGDELRPPGEQLPPGCIHDSNRHAVTAALRQLGACVVEHTTEPDHREVIIAALAAAAVSNDLVVTTGGVSVGEEDHVRGAIESLGFLDFGKLALKPGSPVAFGAVGDTPVLALPGNPVAAMVTFWLLARPLALHLMGAAPREPTRFPVAATFNHRHRPGRREFVRARLRVLAGGVLGVEPFRSHDSGMLSSLTWSDGLVEIPEDAGDIAAGDTVSFLPYDGLGDIT